ncbi:hypothetical protein HWV62_2665 [Athelia sp. TMB]|nr:hypothetical protein HWV62_2665 [Athelia sp. TMB]
MSSASSSEDDTQFIDTVEGEIAFFRSMMRARPVGIHAQFHVLTIRNTILKDTGRTVATGEIWAKLRGMYDMDALEGLEPEGYESPRSQGSTPQTIRSPSPSEDLTNHPHFRNEYTLPLDDGAYEALIAPRRVRDTPSPPSSPPAQVQIPSPVARKRGRPRGDGKARAKRGAPKADMAGLVGGDSDSSALTQESGDEGGAVAKEDDATGTEGGSEMEVDEEDTREESAGPSVAKVGKRGINAIRGESGKFQKVPGPKTRTAQASTPAPSTRSVKRRKK